MKELTTLEKISVQTAVAIAIEKYKAWYLSYPIAHNGRVYWFTEFVRAKIAYNKLR